MYPRPILCCLQIALVVGLVSCKAPPASQAPAFSYYRQPDANVPAVRRVVMFLPENTSKYPRADLDFGMALATELRAANLFEVITVPIDVSPTLAVGHFDETLLAKAYHHHGADAVLFCGVREYHPYWPPRVGATVHLVSTHEAVTMASVDGLWDASDKTIGCQAYEYATKLIPEMELPHAEIVVRSPRYFNRYVARQIVGALATKSPPVIIADHTVLPN